MQRVGHAVDRAPSASDGFRESNIGRHPKAPALALGALIADSVVHALLRKERGTRCGMRGVLADGCFAQAKACGSDRRVNDVDPLRISDERFMRAALDEARAAQAGGDVPVGAVVVRAERIIGRGHNLREQHKDPTAHAEMIAITAASAEVGGWRLDDCTLYVTLEPCVMCAGALVLARLPRLVFGTADPKAGACVSLYGIIDDQRLNHRVELGAPVLTDECAALLRDFFANRR